MYRQHPPYAVQVEMTQGCNLGCSFCGIHALGYQKLQKGTDFMTVERAEHIALQLKSLRWCPRIEFAMHGEPTLNPDRAAIIKEFRKWLPKAYIMVTSNGGGLLKNTTKAIDEMFEAGLNTLALDNYEYVNIVPRVRAAYSGGVEVVDYPADPRGNPHTRHNRQIISIVQDISKAHDGTHAHLNNHAGSAFPLNDRGAGKRCAKPFRELSIRWNGDIAICCNDWPGVYKCGNAIDDGIGTVWHGPAFTAARQMLMEGRREFAPCKGCDATSYRVGLLPDPRGREAMDAPNAATKRAIAKALADGPCTKPVRPPLKEE